MNPSLKSRNPIAKAVRRLVPKIVPDRRRKLLARVERREIAR
jgi:hypothetical protein